MRRYFCAEIEAGWSRIRRISIYLVSDRITGSTAFRNCGRLNQRLDLAGSLPMEFTTQVMFSYRLYFCNDRYYRTNICKIKQFSIANVTMKIENLVPWYKIPLLRDMQQTKLQETNCSCQTWINNYSMLVHLLTTK